MGGGQEWEKGGVGFIMGDGKVSLHSWVSFHSWQRGANFPNLWRPLPILPTSPLSNFVHPPPPNSLSPPTPTPIVLSVVLFFWLNGWMGDHARFDVFIYCSNLFNDNMDQQMSSFSTLVPEGPWCVFYATRHQFYWSLTDTFFYWYSDLISPPLP